MMNLPEPVALIESLARADWGMVIVSTGGGSEAISHLLSAGGASRVVLEAIVPYATQAVDRLLGGPQEVYCSSRTARRLAIVGWQRACLLGTPAPQAVGVAVTAALRSQQPKRGPHRIFVAVQTLTATSVVTLCLEKDARSRPEEERLAAALLLQCIAAECLGNAAQAFDRPLLAGEHVQVERQNAPQAWQELLAGVRLGVGIETSGHGALAGVTGEHSLAEQHAPSAQQGLVAPGQLIFPGAFDPLHAGHRRMAEIAERISSQQVAYELSIVNVDKPLLDYCEMRTRAAQFTDRTLWLTSAASFLEKIALFPDSTFVMGSDTYTRLLELKYYGGSVEAATQAVRQIAEKARRIILFDRARDTACKNLARIDVPQQLQDITTAIPVEDFQSDISSTQLRR